VRPTFPLRVRARGHEAGAQQPLHVEHVVELHLSHLLHQFQERLRAPGALEHIRVVHRLAGPHDRRKDVAHDPRNAQSFALRLERGGHLQRLHDVAKRGGFDDEKFGHGSRGLQNLLLTTGV